MKVLLIALGVIVIIFAGYVGSAAVLRQLDQTSPSSNQQETKQAQNTKQGLIDQNLIGTWETDCWVPSPRDSWAEKHQFVFEKNKATHIRWSDMSGANNCDKPDLTLVNTYTYAIPTIGQINLNDLQNGVTQFDIYKIEGFTLEFGHGVRADYTGAKKISGESEANRIDTLNIYLKYKKK